MFTIWWEMFSQDLGIEPENEQATLKSLNILKKFREFFSVSTVLFLEELILFNHPWLLSIVKL